MKRFVAIFAMILVLCVFCSVAVMADNTIEVVPNDSSDGVTHTVQADPIETVAATCTEDGYYVYKCLEEDCLAENLYHTVVIPATGHSFVEVQADWGDADVVPTCTTTGVAHYDVVCEYCGLVKDTITRELATIDHDYSIEVVDSDATCTTGTIYHYVCSMCGEAETDSKGNVAYHEKDDASSKYHVWTEWNVETEATCCETGLKTRVCTVCSQAQYEVIDKTAHTYEIVDQHLDDCDSITITYQCSACAAYAKANNTSIYALDCTLSTPLVSETSTTYTENYGSYVVETIYGDFHSWTLVEGSCTATCTEAGTETYLCDYCGDAKTVAVKALGHDWDEWVLVETYTGTDGIEYGLYTRGCDRDGCGASQQTVMALADGEPENEGSDDSGSETSNVYTISSVGIDKTDDAVTGTGTLIVVGDDEVGEMYVRVAIVYVNEDGEQLLVVNTAEVKSDLTFNVPSVKAPYGYTVSSVCLVAVTDDVTALYGSWAGVAASGTVIL
ncbi:MAG: hypothetical protein LUH36_05735 [Oscillospiraceae bacterium]|nr:hypothetical protein [Oscillospiraceae bacterium]